MRNLLVRTAAILVVVLVLAGPVTAASLQLGQLPSSAMWVAHADVEAFVHAKIGVFVLDQLKKPEAQAGLTVLKNLTGTDLTRDITSITLYGTAPGEQNGVAIIQGTFDQEKLLPLLRTNPTLREIKVGERTAYQWTDKPKADKPGPQRFGMFYRGNLVLVAGSQSMLSLAVGVLDGRQDSLASASPPKITPSAGTCLGVYVAQVPELPKGEKAAELFKKLVSGRFEAGEADANLFARLTVVTRDAATAGDLAKMAQGFLAFLDLVKDVRDNGRPALPVELATMLKDVKVSAHEATAEASLVTPVQNVTSFLQWAAAQEAAKKAARCQEK